MKKKILIIALTSSLALGSVSGMAQQTTDVDDAGTGNYGAIGIGAVSGGLLLGPLGALLGGFAGSLYHREAAVDHTASREPSEPAIAQAEKRASLAPGATQLVASADHKQIALASPAAREQDDLAGRLKTIVSEKLRFMVNFKPGSVQHEPFYNEQLSVLVELMKNMPEMHLKLEGYADRQGSADDNLALSGQRMASVRQFFIDQGIDESRIELQAFGEKQFLSRPGELDAYFFDRRVMVRLQPGDPESEMAHLDQDFQPRGRGGKH